MQNVSDVRAFHDTVERRNETRSYFRTATLDWAIIRPTAATRRTVAVSRRSGAANTYRGSRLATCCWTLPIASTLKYRTLRTAFRTDAETHRARRAARPSRTRPPSFHVWSDWGRRSLERRALRRACASHVYQGTMNDERGGRNLEGRNSPELARNDSNVNVDRREGGKKHREYTAPAVQGRPSAPSRGGARIHSRKPKRPSRGPEWRWVRCSWARSDIQMPTMSKVSVSQQGECCFMGKAPRQHRARAP